MTTELPLDEKPPSRFDPFFKLLTRLQAEELGLTASETEMQITTKRGDLILSVPPGLSLEGTMFHFFRLKNVVEFKSESDQFTLPEYTRNQMRTDYIFLQGKHETYDDILSVIVSSRRPTKFLSYAKSQGVRFRRDKEKPWLRRAKVGFHHVIIVVCRDLPLEERYYDWLIFAPSNSQKWKEYLQFLAQNGKTKLLDIAWQLRPKKVKMNLKDIDIDALLKKEGVVTSPEFQAELDEAEIVFINYMIRWLRIKTPKNLAKVLSNFKPEEWLIGLPPEEILAGLTSQERTELSNQLKAEMEKITQDQN